MGYTLRGLNVQQYRLIIKAARRDHVYLQTASLSCPGTIIGSSFEVISKDLLLRPYLDQTGIKGFHKQSRHVISRPLHQLEEQRQA
jgi:hypothetical protein